MSQVRTFEALRRLGWNGRYITWAHLNAEEELARIKDGELYVIGTNALFQDNLPVHAEIRAVTHARQAQVSGDLPDRGLHRRAGGRVRAEGHAVAADAAEGAGRDEQPRRST